MRKGSDLIGKPIIAFGGGRQLDKIQDVIFDQQSNQLLGFLVDEGGWFSTARVLPLRNVQAIGPDAVIVSAADAIQSADLMPDIQRILERNNVLKGTKIMTTDGRDLGTLSDLYFDEQSGMVEGYEASGGVFADAYSGRSFVPAPQTIQIGTDVAFVPPETATLMEEQTGGIKAALETAGGRLQDAAHDARSSVTNAIVDPQQQKAFVLGRTATSEVQTPSGLLLVASGQQVTPLVVEEAEREGVLDKLYRATGGSLTQQIGENATNAMASRTIEQAQGRRVQHVVRTQEGLIIAAPGQIVTEQVINRARMYHEEANLLDAVGLSATDAARTNAGATISAAGDRAQSAVGQVQQEAGNLWDRVKEKFSDLQERTSQEVEERRIKGALGRPVTRVILDPQDTVILNVGDLITHRAIEDARRANILDMLLDSVSNITPEISQAELRASEPGRDALPEQQHVNPQTQQQSDQPPEQQRTVGR